MLETFTENELQDTMKLLEEGGRIGVELVRTMSQKKVGGGSSTKEAFSMLTAYSKTQPFTFKGDLTDLSYFWRSKELPISEINALPAALRGKVMSCFNTLGSKEGLLCRAQSGAFALTKAGEELAYSSRFIESVIISDKEFNDRVAKGIAAEAKKATLEGGEQLAEKAGEKLTEKAGEKLAEQGAKAAGAAASVGASVAADVMQKAAEIALEDIEKSLSLK